jgi:DNA-binding Lrp family transcriptional regulator
MGVKKRLEKLKDDIKVKVLINVKNLILAIIAMDVESAEALRNIIEKFKECPRIVRFFVTTGGYNLFALIWVEDYHTLESISLERCSLRAQKGIRRFEIYPIQEVHYEPFVDIKVIPEKKLEFAPCGVHCGTCERYEEKRCMGCPATKFYRGIF